MIVIIMMISASALVIVTLFFALCPSAKILCFCQKVVGTNSGSE